MKTNIIRKQDRRIDQNGWRTAWHEYYPGQTQFGQLTGFNLDVVDPGRGFGLHPHRNMEIITIPTEGAQTHRDSLGNESTISEGEVQVMSAGSGIQHSEMNASSQKPFTSYQIWIYPNQANLTPSYQAKAYDRALEGAQLLVSPDGTENSLKIQQNARIWYVSHKEKITYIQNINQNKSAVYIQVIAGEVAINGEILQTEDSIEIIAEQAFSIDFVRASKLIVIETN